MLNHSLVCGENNTISLWTRSSSIAFFFFVLFCFFFLLSLSLSLTSQGFSWSFWHQMGKGMRWDSKPLSLHYKHNHIFVKFGASILLLGLAFRLFSSDSIRISSVLEETHTPPLAEAEPKTESPVVFQPIQPPLSSVFPENGNHTSEIGEEIFYLPTFWLFQDIREWEKGNSSFFLPSFLYFIFFWFNSLFLLFRN